MRAAEPGDNAARGRLLRQAAAVAGIMALIVVAMPAAAKPQRIVSLYLCADQLVLQLAEREHIISLSRLAANETVSYMAEAARGIPTNDGLAEEAIALNPDLVITGGFALHSRLELLRSLGLNVIELRVARNFAEVRAQTLRVSEALGERARGERLVAGMDARIAAARRGRGTGNPVAVVFFGHGVTLGAETLVDEILSAAGYDNLAVRLGYGSYGYISFEQLLAAAPDLFIFGDEMPRYASLARDMMGHPALRRAKWDRAVLPQRLWACGGTFVAEAVERLARHRDTAGRSRSR